MSASEPGGPILTMPGWAPVARMVTAETSGFTRAECSKASGASEKFGVRGVTGKIVRVVIYPDVGAGVHVEARQVRHVVVDQGEGDALHGDALHIDGGVQDDRLVPLDSVVVQDGDVRRA